MTNEKDTTNPTRDAALRLAEVGWSIIRCYGFADGRCTCGGPHKSPKDVGKHPAVNDWPNASTSDQSTIERWFTDSPNDNIGVNCRASELVVIDIDPRSGGDESFAALVTELGGALPPTVTALTGQFGEGEEARRGRHLFFRCDPAVRLAGAIKGFPGIDVKHNGYVIVAPSRHSTGVAYEWADGCSPFEIVPAELPEALLARLQKGGVAASAADRSDESVDADIDRALWDEIRARRTPVTPYGRAALAGLSEDIRNAHEGERNNTVNRAIFRAGQLVLSADLSLEDAERELRQAAYECQSGPLDDRELESLFAPYGRGFERGAASALASGARPHDGLVNGSASQLARDASETEYLERIGLIDWERLFAEDYEEDWIVPGIICAGRGHVLYGDAGVGKSLLARDIAAHLASGRGALGLSSRRPVRVLYLDQENHPHGDVKRSLVAMGFGPEDLVNLTFLSFPDIPMLDTPAGQAELEALLRRFDPELVIFDTASRFVEGEENSNDTWNRLYNYAGKLLKSMDIAFIRIDHEGKSAASGQRGGSAKKGDVDLVWRLSSSGEGRFLLKNEKSRAFLKEREYVIRREIEPLRHRLDIENRLDWPVFIQQVELQDKRCDIVRDFLNESAANRRMGYQRMWKELREVLKPLDGSRDDMKDIRDWILEGEPMNWGFDPEDLFE